MIKLLHSADWHLDSPIQGRSVAQSQLLKNALLSLPGKVAQICRQNGCDLVLLSGDLFDGAYTSESYRAVYDALEEMAVPVFVAPGNHDFYGPQSIWVREIWPENVHIFTQAHLERVEMDKYVVYGAGFTGTDCAGLLEGFSCRERLPAIGLLHGDPTQPDSPYCPITSAQVTASGLDYLALGHIHKVGSFTAGSTLCAWPGCPMGRGYDETGDKGALLVTLGDSAVGTQFVSIDAPRFYDLQTDAGEDAAQAVSALLSAQGSDDFYRITLTGSAPTPDLPSLYAKFSQFPNLELRDRTTAPVDLWGCIGEDTFEGTYFRLLKHQLDEAPQEQKAQILLAAQISRQLLDGQEVLLP